MYQNLFINVNYLSQKFMAEKGSRQQAAEVRRQKAEVLSLK
jgi:hypothetical protein